MKGRQILIEPLRNGGYAVALMVDGLLEDLLVDPEPSDLTPCPEAIHCAIAGRPMKGTGGVIVDLGNGLTGFLRTQRPPPSGTRLLVQVSGWVESGKAPPVTDRLLLKGQFAILTPGAAGLNISRSICDPERRAELAAISTKAMEGADNDMGMILRSAAEHASTPEIAAEIAGLREDWAGILARANGPAAQLRSAPDAVSEARREWHLRGGNVLRSESAFADQDVWTQIEVLGRARVNLAVGFMTIEPTTALTAVDVNTGPDLGSAASLKANISAARELPRQLRLRGIGGQVIIDFAPISKSDRTKVEAALTAAVRRDGIDTTIAGWTTLGHLEILRKRARRPLAIRRLMSNSSRPMR